MSETLNRQNAETAQDFHPDYTCSQTVTIGPRGGRTMPRIINVRRNGGTKTWKTRPAEFRIPVKQGMYGYGYLDERDSTLWHTGRAEDCTLGTLRASIAAAWPEYAR